MTRRVSAIRQWMMTHLPASGLWEVVDLQLGLEVGCPLALTTPRRSRMLGPGC